MISFTEAEGGEKEEKFKGSFQNGWRLQRQNHRQRESSRNLEDRGAASKDEKMLRLRERG